MTHTPGPWTLDPDPDDEEFFSVYTDTDGINAQIAGSIGEIDNARLIHAAPELAAALKAMLDVQSARRHPLGAPDEGIAYQAADAAAKARAALAKAGVS